MDDLLIAPWDDIQIQILITSDIETLKYFLNWLIINNDIIWPGKNRHRTIISLKSLNNFIGSNTPTVGLINIQDLCNKIEFYKNNHNQYQKDLHSLRNFVLENYNEKTVWNKFKKIIDNVSQIKKYL